MTHNLPKFAVLMTAGSPGPLRVLDELAASGFYPHTIYLMTPGWRHNLKRVVRKFKSSGVLGTARRISQALRQRFVSSGAGTVGSNEQVSPVSNARILRVERFHDQAVIDDARSEGFEVFLAMTDEILRRKVFSLPRMGTLNAHPAKNPEYRGLSSLERMLRDKKQPVVTLHLINEGIDTGPIIARIPITDRLISNGQLDERVVSKWQAAAFSAGLNRLKEGQSWEFLDCFLEPSNMSFALSNSEVSDILKASSANKN